MVRVCCKSGALIHKPKFEHMKYENKHLEKVDGLLDTFPEKV